MSRPNVPGRRWSTLLAAALVTTIAACSDDAPNSVDVVATPSEGDVIGTGAPAGAIDTTATTATSGDGERATPPAGAPASPAVALTLVGSFDQPVGLAVRAGDSALYVIEQAGRIVRAEPGFGAEPETVVVADVTALTSAEGERGLLGLAFSPDGTEAFLDYTDRSGDTVVARYPVAADGTFDVSGGRQVIAIDQPYSNHNGGDLAFGPDAKLYVALGDGGSADDPERRASDPTTLLGKVLRIDPIGATDGPYAIPPDNPFAPDASGAVAVEGAPEVWLWGVRNPWRIAFDPDNGDLWIADVGQNQYEEVDHLVATDGLQAGRGADLGWSAFEGDARFNDDVADPGDLVFPVHTYQHGADGCSISGGAVYRGTEISSLAGRFVYSDYCSGIVWAYDPVFDTNATLLTGLEQVAAVRAGPDGELYVVELSGDVFRLIEPVS
jgi:glucose/arabinose dehydrogenase